MFDAELDDMIIEEPTGYSKAEKKKLERQRERRNILQILNDRPLRIMLLGRSGVGKSASGNTILGRYVFESDMKLGRVTRYCEEEVGVVKDVPVDVTRKAKDVPVTVIDTPGFFGKDCNKEDIVREILQCIELQTPGAHAFVLVVPIARMTQEDQDTNNLIEAMFGPKVWDYAIVLFTHGDHLKEKTINDYITESDNHLCNLLRKCGGGFHVFNNKNPQDQAQVTSFIAKVQTMVALNRGHCYNTDLYPKQERRIRKRQMSIMREIDFEIRSKEKQLEDRFKEPELKVKRKELWREEETRARLAAERETRRNSYVRNILGLILLMAGIVLAAALESIWPLVVGIMILLRIFSEELKSIYGDRGND